MRADAQSVLQESGGHRTLGSGLRRVRDSLAVAEVALALALVLAFTGVYGVISSVATSRRREFAIRVALGADRARVTRLVLGQGVHLTAIGLGVGLCGTLASVPLLQDLPVSVRPPDVITVAPVVVFIAITALAACLVPARRAAHVDPMSVLRNE
jgi:ABC-type antimicrobial peptide transport system permease subunit